MKWTATRLKHVCVDAGQYGLNISAEQYSSNGARLIRTSDLTEAGVLKSADNAVYVDAQLEARYVLEQGDLLLSRSGTLGRSFLVPHLEARATFAGYLVRFRPRSGVDPRFLAYYATSTRFQDIVSAESVSSTIQNFNAERYANIPLAMPGLEEQRRIADFLDAETGRIDEMVRLQTRARSLVAERDSVLLDRTLERLYEQAPIVPLRRFITKMDQGSSPQCDSFPAGPSEWGVLKVSSLRPGVFLEDENKRLPDEIVPDVRREVRKGDILIVRANTPDLVGSVAVVPRVRPKLLLSDKIFRIGIAPNVDPFYIAAVARGGRVRSRSAASSHGASQSMANLRFDEVKSWPIPIIDLAKQRSMVSRLSEHATAVVGVVDKIDQQLALLAERRQALITAAVTGQIDVTTARGVDVS